MASVHVIATLALVRMKVAQWPLYLHINGYQSMPNCILRNVSGCSPSCQLIRVRQKSAFYVASKRGALFHPAKSYSKVACFRSPTTWPSSGTRCRTCSSSRRPSSASRTPSTRVSRSGSSRPMRPSSLSGWAQSCFTPRCDTKCREGDEYVY